MTASHQQLSDVVLQNTATATSIPPGNGNVTDPANSGSAHMNSLKSMAENAILNLTPQQQQQQQTQSAPGFNNNNNG